MRQPLLALAALLVACGPAGGRDGPSYVSAELPACPADRPDCDPLAAAARDSALLVSLADGAIDPARLAGLTGVEWRERRGRDGVVHARLAGVNPLEEARTAYVIDVLTVDAPHDTVLSISSNGGTAVWLNGQPLGRSRDASRALRAHQDLYTAPLRAGRNVVLYKVLTTSEEAQLHREWRAAASLPELLDAAIVLGAWTGLPLSPIIADSATVLPLKPPQVRLADRPHVRLRWRTLLGETLADGGVYQGVYPERLPLPAAFDGMAVLETEVTDAGERRYYEQLPVFADSTARRLARELTGSPVPATPVHAARVAAVRAFFALDSSEVAGASDWNRAYALADLYRAARRPDGFHRFPGPQVWGYRAEDGTVQPYWLTVPPGAVGLDPVAAADPGLVFSITHMVDSSFWRGRGRSEGWVAHMATLSAVHGTFSVLPHLRGRHDFAALGREELRAITRQVDSVFGIDTARVAILAWSAHAVETMGMAQDPQLPLAHVGFAVPALHADIAGLEAALDSIRAVRPRLHWTLWRAAEDDRIPRERTERWVKAIRRADFPIEYREVEYSTHLGGFFHDVEAELHRQVAAPES